MMNELKFSEIGTDRAMEIAKLAYGFDDWIRSDLDVAYQPYDETMFEDAAEYWRVMFDAVLGGDTVARFRFWIHPTLDLELDAIFPNPEGPNKMPTLLGRFPLRNQHEIHKKFIEWGLKPSK